MVFATRPPSRLLASSASTGRSTGFIYGVCARIRPQRGKLRPPFQFEETFLAKPNYSFEKRQREIARKKKQDDPRCSVALLANLSCHGHRRSAPGDRRR